MHHKPHGRKSQAFYEKMAKSANGEMGTATIGLDGVEMVLDPETGEKKPKLEGLYGSDDPDKDRAYIQKEAPQRTTIIGGVLNSKREKEE